MEEARQAWASLKSSISLNGGNGNADESNANSTTIWYDVPAPVIVHCREFRDELESDGEDDIEKAAGGNDSPDDRDGRSASVVSTEKERSATVREGGRRHRNTVELTAVTSVETDDDGGVPKISFSFLRADKKCQTFPRAAANNENDRERASAQDELYDFPRNSYVCDEIESEKVVESERETEVDGDEIRGTILAKLNAESVPRDLGNEIDEKAAVPVESGQRCVEEIVATEKATSYDRPRRSTRSLRYEKKARTTDATSGYHSDPQCSNGSPRKRRGLDGVTKLPPKHQSSIVDRFESRAEARAKREEVIRPDSSMGLVACNSSPSVSSRSRRRRICSANPRQSQQKHRLGKAWEKMRSWLRDETSKINEVVNKHARLQAVGALARQESRTLVISQGNHSSGSYDLTDARPRESGSITRIEEFGLSTVSKENLSCSASSSSSSSSSSSPPPRPPPSDPIPPINDRPRGRIGSTPASFDARKLCSDTENEETTDNVAVENENRDHARKAGLIKRRMLGSIRGLMASTHLLHVLEPEEAGQGGFEDVRRYVKQGGDFCKELASILHERAELEATYAKGLSKLSNKLTKACAKDQGGNSGGGVNEAWRCVGEEMEAAAEAHRIWGMTLGEQLAKPIRVGVAEAQGRSRKSIENSVDKAGKSLHEWRNVAMKSKKQSFACARENERLQDLARLQSISQQSQQANNKSSNHHMTEKEASKLETRRRKAEDSSRRADMEFYTVSVRAERARLEYESTVRKGAKQMELLEEERLSALKDLANVYLAHLQTLAPRLQQSADRLAAPIRNCNVSQDIEILKNLIRRVESNDGSNSEQLLPDFYAEHVTLAMNRERRKQALVRVLHLIRQDLERERRGREGLETLHRAFVATPAFAADESTRNVTEKLHHMRSMLLYLEAARYKVGGTLTEVEGSKRGKHPLAEHILVSRDKQGLQQSVLKIPSWAKNESFEVHDDDDNDNDDNDEDEIDVQLVKDHDTESRHWTDRTAGDGNSENPPDEDDFSDFDEFSSQSEDNNNQDVDTAETVSKPDGTEQCRAIYQYSANLNDELSLSPGDLITVHQKQPDGWWIGECRGRTGIFPATYVQVIR